MSSIVSNNLFAPLRVGNIQLQHRIVMAPVTRLRASEDYVPSEVGHSRRKLKLPSLLTTKSKTDCKRILRSTH